MVVVPSGVLKSWSIFSSHPKLSSSTCHPNWKPASIHILKNTKKYDELKGNAKCRHKECACLRCWHKSRPASQSDLSPGIGQFRGTIRWYLWSVWWWLQSRLHHQSGRLLTHETRTSRRFERLTAFYHRTCGTMLIIVINLQFLAIESIISLYVYNFLLRKCKKTIMKLL